MIQAELQVENYLIYIDIFEVLWIGLLFLLNCFLIKYGHSNIYIILGYMLIFLSKSLYILDIFSGRVFSYIEAFDGYMYYFLLYAGMIITLFGYALFARKVIKGK